MNMLLHGSGGDSDDDLPVVGIFYAQGKASAGRIPSQRATADEAPSGRRSSATSTR